MQVTFRVPVIRLKSHNLGTTSVSAASHSIDSQPPLWVLGECKGLHLTAGSRRPAGQRRPATGALRRKMVAQPDEAQLLHVRVSGPPGYLVTGCLAYRTLRKWMTILIHDVQCRGDSCALFAARPVLDARTLLNPARARVLSPAHGPAPACLGNVNYDPHE